MTYRVAVRRAGAEIAASSSIRLPFQPRGWPAEFRRELGAACRSLVADHGQVLHATYTSADRSPVDLENVLTYNLGTSAIRAAATHGLVLERSYDPAPADIHPHHYRYRLVQHDRPWAHWRPGHTLGSVRLRAPKRLFTEPKAGRWWLHARRHGTSVVARPTGVVPDRFALRLTITPPTGWRGHLAGLVKPVADGLIAALHAHDGDPGPVADRAPSIEPDLTPAEFGALLSHPPRAALGRTCLVVPWGATLQWLPADDRIVAMDVRLSDDHEPGTVLAEALAALG